MVQVHKTFTSVREAWNSLVSLLHQNCPDQEEPNPTVSYNALGVMSEDDQLYFAVQIARGMVTLAYL